MPLVLDDIDMSKPSIPENKPGVSYLAQRNQRYTLQSGNTKQTRQPTSTRSPPSSPSASPATTMIDKPSSTSGKRSQAYDTSPPPPPKRPRTGKAPEPTADFRDKLSTVISITARGAPEKNVKTLQLHVKPLSEKSPYLRHLALTSPSPELRLLELDSDAFGIFADWKYTGTIKFTPHPTEGAEGTEGANTDEGDILPSVLSCHLLSQTLQCPSFSNAVLKRACAISASHGLVFRNAAINEIYLRTVDEPECAEKMDRG